MLPTRLFLLKNLDRSELSVLDLQIHFSVTADCYRRYTVIDLLICLKMLNFFGEIRGGRFLITPGPTNRTYTTSYMKLSDAAADVAHSQSC